MTQEELDAIPSMGGIGYREETRDGKKVRIPYAEKSFALFDPVFVTGNDGRCWMVGTYKGIKYKSEVRPL